MALEIEGKIIKFLPEMQGEGSRGPWIKQDFVLETFGEYPKKICFSTWNERAKEIKNFPIGSPLKVAFSAESREYNERWYTDLRAYRFGPLANMAGVSATQPTTTNVNDAPPPVEPPVQEEEEDDLPF